MAYISAEEVKAIRDSLKKQFPQIKFSVTRSYYSGISVAIMAAPFRFSVDDYKRLNHYYPEKYENVEVLKQIIDICMKGNHDNSDIQSDYFDVGWYLHLTQGRYDKPFKQV
jgi:hypothetical protein